MNNLFRRNILVLSAIVLSLVCAPLASLAADDAAPAPALKADTPKVDPSADMGHRDQRPLQAGIEHNETVKPVKVKPLRTGVADNTSKPYFGKLRGGAKTATVDTLKGATGNQGLNAAATSGFGIIGVKFVLAGGAPPVINRVFGGTPAETVGLRINDKIVAVDGVPTYGLSKEEVYDLIIGSPGTSVNLSIQHNGDFRVVTCTRMDINDITDPVVRRDYLSNM